MGSHRRGQAEADRGCLLHGPGRELSVPPPTPAHGPGSGTMGVNARKEGVCRGLSLFVGIMGYIYIFLFLIGNVGDP